MRALRPQRPYVKSKNFMYILHMRFPPEWPYVKSQNFIYVLNVSPPKKFILVTLKKKFRVHPEHIHLTTLRQFRQYLSWWDGLLLSSICNIRKQRSIFHVNPY